MRVKILGSAAGGGFPQWNCGCSNCFGIRHVTLRSKARTQTQVAVCSRPRSWFLLNASPDLRGQIESSPELHPPQAVRGTPISGVVLTSGELDNVLGLLLLREFQPLEIFATPAIRKIVSQQNRFFRSLERVNPQAHWNDIHPGTAFELRSDKEAAGLCCHPIALEGSYPAYADSDQLPQNEALVGLVLEKESARMLFLPALPSLTDELLKEMKNCDLLLLDGTFWSDEELKLVRGNGASAREMGHVPISGPGGSLELLRRIGRPRKIYLHINNTNPVLNEDSAQRHQVCEVGWEIAEDGWEFDL